MIENGGSSPAATPVVAPHVLLMPADVSKFGVQFIANFEGFRPVAYNDAAQPPNATIGYGHLLHRGPVTARDMKSYVTRDQAYALLRQDAQAAVVGVHHYCRVHLTTPQFDALVSFVFNCGVGAFQTSTLLRHLNAHSYQLIPGDLMQWVHAGNVVLPGLVNRRRAEGNLFAHGTY